jgi:peroxiredoxin
VLIGINQEETLEVVEPFVADFGLTFPIWLDENYLAQRKFNTMNLPSSFVIDRGGTVRLLWVGGVSERFLEKHVTKIIKE